MRRLESHASPSCALVDDEQPIRLLCRINLEAEGMTVDEATDGEQALSTIAARRPDAAILDVMMPGIDGWEVAPAYAPPAKRSTCHSSSSPPSQGRRRKNAPPSSASRLSRVR